MNERQQLHAAFNRALQALEGWSQETLFGLMRIYLSERHGIDVSLFSTEDLETLSGEHARLLERYLSKEVTGNFPSVPSGN
jgi:hypothetical protein